MFENHSNSFSLYKGIYQIKNCQIAQDHFFAGRLHAFYSAFDGWENAPTILTIQIEHTCIKYLSVCDKTCYAVKVIFMIKYSVQFAFICSTNQGITMLVFPSLKRIKLEKIRPIYHLFAPSLSSVIIYTDIYIIQTLSVDLHQARFSKLLLSTFFKHLVFLKFYLLLKK